MAFSLGSLFVELKANTAQFLDGMSKASAYAAKTGKDIERALGKAGELLSPLGELGEKLAGVFDAIGSSALQAFSSVGKMGGALGVLTAGVGGATALGGAMIALAEHAAEVGAKIYEASEKTGISASQMSGLMAITKETGGDFETLSTSLARAGANLEKGIISPGGQVGKVLSQVMGGAKQLTDLGLKPMGDRLQTVTKAIFGMHDEGERNLALQTLLGKGWQENVSALKLLAEQGYAPAIEQAKKFGMYFDASAAAQAKQFQIAIASMKAEISGLALAVGQSVMPVFTRFAGMLQGLGRSAEATAHAAASVVLAVTGDFKGAMNQWREYQEAAKADTQAQTDFLVHVQGLTAGEKAASETTKTLTAARAAHRDVLADLVAKESDELRALDSTDKPVRALRDAYNDITREIQKAVAEGGNYAEALQAQALAADIFAKKLMQIPGIVPKLPKAEPATPPELQVPGIPAGLLGNAPMPTGLTLAELAKLPAAQDNVRLAERALRLETDLSSDSFKKLAAAFPGLSEAEVAALPAGQRMIDQLTKMDKLGSVGQQFTELKNTLITEGDELGSHLVQTLGGAVNSMEDQLAHLAVTGKANFKSLYQSIGEQLTKAGLQKGVSMLLGGLHLGGGAGSKRTGNTAQDALYVTPVNDSGRGLGGPLGALGHGAGGGGAPGAAGSSIFGALSTDAKSLLSIFGNAGKSIFGALGGLFGGFMADGGDVTPGKAYMVGERHPEFFVPGRSGQIVPSLSVQQLRPLTYAPTFHVNTPNADSFRRSQAQILADGYRQMALHHSRNS